MSFISSIISLLVGVFLGHKLSLGREKRKEYNEKFDIVFNQIHTERKLWSYIPLESVRDRIDHNDMEILLLLYSDDDKGRLKVAWENYLTTIDENDPFSDPDEHYYFNFNGVPSIISSLDTLLKVMKRK